MWTILGYLLLSFSFAFNYPAKVIKIQNNKILLKIPKNVNAEKGEILYLSDESEGSKDLMTTPNSNSSRKNFLGGELDLRYLTTSGVLSSTAYEILDFSGFFGMNFKNYEIAPIFSYQKYTLGSSSSQSWFGGFFADLNFSENIKGTSSVWSARALISYGSENSTPAISIIRGQAGLVYKWFLSNSNLAIGLQVGYRYESLSNETTRSGPIVNINIQNYFSL